MHEHRFPPQLPLQWQVVLQDTDDGEGGTGEGRGGGGDEVDSIELKEFIGDSEPKSEFRSWS